METTMNLIQFLKAEYQCVQEYSEEFQEDQEQQEESTVNLVEYLKAEYIQLKAEGYEEYQDDQVYEEYQDDQVDEEEQGEYESDESDCEFSVQSNPDEDFEYYKAMVIDTSFSDEVDNDHEHIRSDSLMEGFMPTIEEEDEVQLMLYPWFDWAEECLQELKFYPWFIWAEEC